MYLYAVMQIPRHSLAAGTEAKLSSSATSSHTIFEVVRDALLLGAQSRHLISMQRVCLAGSLPGKHGHLLCTPLSLLPSDLMEAKPLMES